MERVWNSFNYLPVIITAFVAQACSGLGYQGGAIPTTFTGLTSVQAVSPASIKLSWSSYPGATVYNVYTPDQNAAIASPGFTSYFVQPNSPDPTVTYQYSVTAVDPLTGEEQGLRSAYMGTKLLPHFDFADQGSITAVGNNSVRVNWPAYPLVEYQVFVAEKSPTGTVAYNNFIASQQTVTGVGSATINNLLEGHEYCAIVVASYSDGLNDGPNNQALPAGVGISAALSAEPSVITASQKCTRTQSDFNASAVTIYTQKATLSNQPVFYANVPSSMSVSTSIYQVTDDATGAATLVANAQGAGKIATQSAIASGRYHFFAVVQDLTSVAQAQVEINVGPNGTTPTSAQARQWVYIRSFNATEAPTASTGYYPQKQQGGFGAQNEGSSVAIGDFNCDGKKDLAIGIPNASVMAADNRPAQSGQVIIYYDMSSSGGPAASAAVPASGTNRIQTITFDITSFAGDSSRNLQLGTSLYVGNFNNDNQATNQPAAFGASLGFTPNSNFECDDLAIGSGYGPMFVLYGHRDTLPASGSNAGSQDGGLYYQGPQAFSRNPSGTCDALSNICYPAMYYQTGNSIVNGVSNTSYNYGMGMQMTSGDYNGDGYEDLAITTQGASAGTPHGIWVFRGSEYGLIPPASFDDTNDGYTNGGTVVAGVDSALTTPGTYTSFPFIPARPQSFYGSPDLATNPTGITTVPAGNWGTGSTTFGQSIGTLHNAYYDNYTNRIRDVLLIGNPSVGTITSPPSSMINLVHMCVPMTLTDGSNGSTLGQIGTTVDVNKNLYWDCSHYLSPPNISTTSTASYASMFGLSMTSLKNPLRYMPEQFTETQCPSQEGFGNCFSTSPKLGYPGGVVIGSSSGEVFAYYGVSQPISGATDRATRGINRNTYLLGNGSGGSTLGLQGSEHPDGSPILVTTGSACQITSGGGAEYCDIQAIHHPTTSAGNFGQVLGSFPGNVVTGNPGVSPPKDTILAVAAPYRGYTINGTNYTNVGSVQLFLQNSVFNTNPINVTGVNNACANQPTGSNTGVCRFADGFSNSLTTSLDYDGTISNNTNFGLGGIVGGPLFANASNYSPNTDIVVGVPGHVAHPVVASGTSPSVIDNGAAFTFFSHAGTYRDYEISNPDNAAPNSPWHQIDQSFSQESNMKFHEAISVGDLNHDGIGDVVVRINQGPVNTMKVYYGTSGSVGFDTSTTSATASTNFIIEGDTSAGIRFVPVGNLNNTNFPAYFITGSGASYLVFDGLSGLVGGFPTAFGAGGVPRKFYSPAAVSASGAPYLNFSDAAFWNSETPTALTTTFASYNNFAMGDFNGDGYPDVAIGFNSDAGITNSGSSFTGNGRVMIFYGGASNGFQTQPDVNGGYPLDNTTFTDYSADNLPNPSSGAPCPAAVNTSTPCKIQMLHENNTTYFGSSLASVPVGNCTMNGNSVPVNALVVSTLVPSGAYETSALYVYRPKCLDTANNASGLISYADGNASIPKVLPTPDPTLLPAGNSTTFGTSMTAVTNLLGPEPAAPANTNLISHLVVTDQAKSQVVVYPILKYGTIANTNFHLPVTAGAISNNFNGDSSFYADGGRLIQYSQTAMMSGTTGTAAGFGTGVAAIGDVNGDGYTDIGISLSSLARSDTSDTIASQGTVLVLFGGPTGLQALSAFGGSAINPSRTAACYVSPSTAQANLGTPTSTCNPTLLYAPQSTNSLRDGAYEYSYLSPFSFVNTGTSTFGPNEGLGTFLFGIPGRDSLDDAPTGAAYGSTRILQAGAFYVLP